MRPSIPRSVMYTLGCAIGLMSVQRSGRDRYASLGWALAAGMVGSSALLVKQNFADALVFCGVLVLTSGLKRRIEMPATVRLLEFGTLSAAVPLLMAGIWAVGSGGGLGELWYTL